MSDGSGSEWQCFSCSMKLPMAPAMPQCPYCLAIQPGAVLEHFQTDPAVSVQPFYFGTDGNHNYSPRFIPVQEQSQEARVCIHCKSYLPPNSETCTYCVSWSQGAPERFQQVPQNQQKGQKNIHKIVNCKCGAEFKHGYKVCANCGSPAPRNQPQGPPCVHCGELLIKKDASRCVKCGRVQPGNVKPSNPPTTPVSLPPGLFQGRNPTNTSHSHSATPQPNIPHSVTQFVPYPNYNFPRMFGPFASNLGSWPRMPTPLQHVQCSNMGNNQPSLGASHTNVPSSTQQLTVSHETGVSVNQPSQQLAENNSKNLPGVPSSARPSSNFPGGDTVQSDPKDVVQTSKDLQNLSKQAQQPVSTSAHNMNNNKPDKSTTEENIKGSTDKPITTSASSSAVTSTTVSNSGSIASTSPTTTTTPAKASYAGVVKVSYPLRFLEYMCV